MNKAVYACMSTHAYAIINIRSCAALTDIVDKSYGMEDYYSFREAHHFILSIS